MSISLPIGLSDADQDTLMIGHMSSTQPTMDSFKDNSTTVKRLDDGVNQTMSSYVIYLMLSIPIFLLAIAIGRTDVSFDEDYHTMCINKHCVMCNDGHCVIF